MTKRGLLLLSLALAAVPSAGAQDSSCSVPPSDGVRSGYIYGMMTAVSAPTIDTAYAQLFLDVVRQGLTLPSPLVLAEYNVTDTVAVAAAYAAYRMQIDRSGHLHHLVLITSSLSPAIDRSVWETLLRLDSAGMLPLRLNGPHSLDVELELETGGTKADSEFHAHGTATRAILPWLEVRLPAWSRSRGPQPGKGGAVPFYPEVARRAGVEDSVTIRFVIDPTGHYAAGSGEVEGGHYREFAQSINDWLPKRHFVAGTIAGCPVNSLVFEPFIFRLER